VLEGLDASHKRAVVAFLYDTRLITPWRPGEPVAVELFGADLTEADLGGASPSGAFLGSANLGEANLRGATVTEEQLEKAWVLEGATMPNGQKYEEWLKSTGREEDGKNE
jgi:hypothetical protein